MLFGRPLVYITKRSCLVLGLEMQSLGLGLEKRLDYITAFSREQCHTLAKAQQCPLVTIEQTCDI